MQQARWKDEGELVHDVDWAGPSEAIGKFIANESKRTLKSYRAQPSLVIEHANQEQDTARGGYAHRQLIELIQNSADQLAKSSGGRILILLSHTHLYCADNGAPLNKEGARALLFSHLSPKRETSEIGRFGLGFKSMLRISDRPAVFSRSGSFQFDRTCSEQQIRRIAPTAKRYPVLRIAKAINPKSEAESDAELRELMNWAVNVVRLPLRKGTESDLAEQLLNFQASFLLFVPHVEFLNLVHMSREREATERKLRIKNEEGSIELIDGSSKTRWMVFERLHKLTPEALEESRSLDNTDTVRISWAAPRSFRRPIQQFWAYFPTQTSSLVNGILNAPWKTNEDRQSLLPGVYNNELISASARLVAESLSYLYDPESPARHLDYLPRRHEFGDNQHAERLRTDLYDALKHSEVIPDQLGRLRTFSQVRIQHSTIIFTQRRDKEFQKRWTEYEHRSPDWLHDETLSNERLSAIARIAHGSRANRNDLFETSIDEWLSDLVLGRVKQVDPVGASRTALQFAAALKESRHCSEVSANIVLTESGDWVPPVADQVYLTDGTWTASATTVHSKLMDDADTLGALRLFGIYPPSAEGAMRTTCDFLLKAGRTDSAGEETDSRLQEFWLLSRKVSDEFFFKTVQSYPGWRYKLEAKALDGKWHPVSYLLCPGYIVPADGSRDSNIVIDTMYHKADQHRFDGLGVVDTPCARRWEFDMRISGPFSCYEKECRESYYKRDLPRNPHQKQLSYSNKPTAGPLEMYPYLSVRGRMRFTEALLDLETTYSDWTMWHETQDGIYPEVPFPSPAINFLQQFGVVKTVSGTHKLSDGFGNKPKNPDVRRWINRHRNTLRMRKAFDLTSENNGPFEPIGDDEPIPLLDVWPGLSNHLGAEHQTLDLVLCDEIIGRDGSRILQDCLVQANNLYLLRQDEEHLALSYIVRELCLPLDSNTFELILSRKTPQDIESKREEVRALSTDAERLLKAVGESNLLARLPEALVNILTEEELTSSGIRIAQAAIATYHTGALREYKNALKPLGPPDQWAGRLPALKFVRSLGFDDEWAGSPRLRREPFVDVTGPFSLPPLHCYQNKSVKRVKALLGAIHTDDENRGLLSLPTGSGKTRVAVQAIIEAIRDEDFRSSILWVADRDELCEQAVEAWQQAWMSIGPETESLRISRLWSGQPTPEVSQSTAHVIIATIQTLRSRMSRNIILPGDLDDVGLLVVDEAHGSIAPSYTSLMAKLGLTFRRGELEIALLGLTATPYRGRDCDETRRLVNRYGANRLDAGTFASDNPASVIAELQEMAVLAEVDHDIIQGETMSLNEAELTQMESSPWLPDSAEQRIASSADRTRRIVDAYLEKVHAVNADWPALIFATSVAHAETIAALLQLKGVFARAVSSKTDAAIRRQIVKGFREGQLKVLVNYGVFREGFDAPKTRAIIVARPVYSPNLYFQMIGRGLRGELNGGSARCLILDVADNIENYDQKLAYTELDDLWD